MKEAKSISEPRLTSRPWEPQDLIDALQEMIDDTPHHYHDDRRTTLCMARDFLEEHFAENRWISVKDRLPDRSEYYLCYVDSPQSFCCVRAILPYASKYKLFNAFDGVSANDAKKYAINVTHWMPLPEPPKEVSDNDC